MAGVAEFINQATGYANKMLENATNALRGARENIEYKPVDETGIVSVEPPQPPEINFDLPPELPPIDLTLPPVPKMEGTLIDVGDVLIGVAPEFTATAPALELPNKPSALPAFGVTPPQITTDVVFPEPPPELDATIVPPTIVDRQAPVKPSVTLPMFTANAPVNTAVAPTDLAQQMREHYKQAVPEMVQMLDGQLDAMLARINPRFHQQMGLMEDRLERLMAGGSGIDSAVETAIYERARDKAHAEYRRLHDGAWNDAAERGFTLPTGALLQTQFSARLALADANARAAQDIAIKQAEMEQQNLQFAITTSATLRTTILNAALGYHQALVSINGQALEAAKAVAGLVLETYNAKVKEFELHLEAYKVEAAVFETRLKGALAAIDLYRSEIEALQAMTQVDVAKIGMYESRVKVLGVLADVYRSRIAAVQSKAELEKLKIDLFQSQVQSYGAMVQAKNAEWQGYQAAIGGEEAKVRIFGEQVQAYTAQMNGHKTKVEAQAESVRAKVAANQAVLMQYESQLKAFTAEVGARADIAKISGDFAQTKLSYYQAQISSKVTYYGALLDMYRANVQMTTSTSDFRLRARIADAQNHMEAQKASAQLELGAGEAYSAIAQAALSGMNSIVSMTEESTPVP